jgi:hypothetical protein
MLSSNNANAVQYSYEHPLKHRWRNMAFPFMGRNAAPTN